jgi:coenzyme F420-reducing hydrogenase delta subunit
MPVTDTVFECGCTVRNDKDKHVSNIHVCAYHRGNNSIQIAMDRVGKLVKERGIEWEREAKKAKAQPKKGPSRPDKRFDIDG